MSTLRFAPPARILFLVLALLGSGAATAATFTVINTADAGTGSLRWAINQANGAAGADTIAFNIAGSGVHMISLTSALPTLSTTINIDGTTQPGYAGAPLIDVNGAAAGAGVHGLNVNASN